MLQKFKFADTDDYKMDVKEALTRKPGGFEELNVPPSGAPADHVRRSGPADRRHGGAGRGQRCRGEPDWPTAPAWARARTLARTIADRGERSGFGTTLVGLDELGDNLPTEGLLVVVASSYNGKAPDNAQRFDDLLAAGLPEGSLSDVRFALLGAGNTQWVATYQGFPKRIEAGLLAAGATRQVIEARHRGRRR